MASIRELHTQLIKKERSAVEITQEAIERIQAIEPKLHSFLCVTAEQAVTQARNVDAKIAAGEEIGICVLREFPPPAPLEFWKILYRLMNQLSPKNWQMLVR